MHIAKFITVLTGIICGHVVWKSSQGESVDRMVIADASAIARV